MNVRLREPRSGEVIVRLSYHIYEKPQTANEEKTNEIKHFT